MEVLILLMVGLFALVAIGVILFTAGLKLYMRLLPLDAKPDVWAECQEQDHEDAKRRFYPFYTAGKNALSAYEAELTRH